MPSDKALKMNVRRLTCEANNSFLLLSLPLKMKNTVKVVDNPLFLTTFACHSYLLYWNSTTKASEVYESIIVNGDKLL